MAILGKLLRNRRAGEHGLAWCLPNLAAESLFPISSPDFADESALDQVHAAKRAGGHDRSPALAWSGIPSDTAQLLLVVEDPDAPMSSPIVHCVALLEPTVTELAQGALSAASPGSGVRILRSVVGRGYHGPAPIKGHGPHRYVFQLFALPEAVHRVGRRTPESAKPRAVMGAAKASARGRIVGVYERR
ncbi:YbhB/YbcL family Raf kinase inhibitor-like protein [Nocardia callitridis]|uniref:YbhB/YbcL family Raf kinase inhibitor-like protein n=1 Tax=Nocardia callitridis TaxID=648753 RepID=A0ABP9KT63_9NOCA